MKSIKQELSGWIDFIPITKILLNQYNTKTPKKLKIIDSFLVFNILVLLINIDRSKERITETDNAMITELLDTLTEAIADFWGDCNADERDVFRASYPDHWINRAEKIVNDAKVGA